MGYKLLGFIVWQGAKLYLRRRVQNGSGRKVAIAGLGALVIGGLVVAQRQNASN
jgi:hypothetical protein